MKGKNNPAGSGGDVYTVDYRQHSSYDTNIRAILQLHPGTHIVFFEMYPAIIIQCIGFKTFYQKTP